MACGVLESSLQVSPWVKELVVGECCYCSFLQKSQALQGGFGLGHGSSPTWADRARPWPPSSHIAGPCPLPSAGEGQAPSPCMVWGQAKLFPSHPWGWVTPLPLCLATLVPLPVGLDWCQVTAPTALQDQVRAGASPLSLCT